jgi:hypothetical protein
VAHGVVALKRRLRPPASPLLLAGCLAAGLLAFGGFYALGRQTAPRAPARAATPLAGTTARVSVIRLAPAQPLPPLRAKAKPKPSPSPQPVAAAPALTPAPAKPVTSTSPPPPGPVVIIGKG